MKKFITFLLTAGMILSMNTIAFASSDVKIKVNGTLLSDAQAILKDGSTLLPVRSVSTALGGEVVWDNATKTVSIDKDGTAVAITIGKKEITVNDKKQAISTPAQIVNGRTYVPLRALGEALECDINWVNATKTVEIEQVDPSEYKVWYEVDDHGRLFLRSNINSNKWNGYAIITRYIMKDHSVHWDTKQGDNIVHYHERAFLTHVDPDSVVRKSEFYIFKGRESEDKFWDLFDRYQGNLPKILSLMQEEFVCTLVLDNDILIKPTEQKINFTDLKITYDRSDMQEYYTVSIADPISRYGEYGLNFDAIRRDHYASYSPLERDGNTLIYDNGLGYFTIPGASGDFSLLHGVYSMDENGTITLAVTTSNKIKHTFPLY